MKLLQGIIVASITPITDGMFDSDAFREHIDYLVDGGIHGIFPLGTNGEFPHLNLKDRKKVIEVAVDQADGRVPVVCGTGSTGTGETLELSRHAEDVGADYLCIIDPYYYRLDQEGLLEHVFAVSSAVDLPIVLYSIPKFTGNRMSADTFKQALSLSNVCGLKDSSGELDTLRLLIEEFRGNKSFLSGSDALIYPALEIGGDGAVSAVANCFPDVVAELYDVYIKGDTLRAETLQVKVSSIRDVLKSGPYMSGIKACLRMVGLDRGLMIPPLRDMPKDIFLKVESELSTMVEMRPHGRLI